MKVSINMTCDRCGVKVKSTFADAPSLGWNTLLLRPFLSDDATPDVLLGDICDLCSSEVAAAIANPEYGFTVRFGKKK